MNRIKTVLKHLAVLLGLLVIAAAQATWQGALWPFDPRYSVMVTGAGLALLAMGWGLVWLVPVLLAALARPLAWRIALWPLGVAGFVALHAAYGPARGFAALDALTWPGALALYAIPVALALVLGSMLGALVRRN